MSDWSLMNPLSHVLLIDTESVSTMQGLVENAGELCRLFCQMTGETKLPQLKHMMHLVFPESRRDLVAPAEKAMAYVEQWGGMGRIQAVPSSEMYTDLEGKAALLAREINGFPGVMLLTDVPIAARYASDILSMLRPFYFHSPEPQPIGDGRHSIVIPSGVGIPPEALLRLHGHYSFGDLLTSISESIVARMPARKPEKKWWQIGS